MCKMPDMFASKVFNDRCMRERLAPDTYEKLRETVREGKALDLVLANDIAEAMKDWAVENGCTHYTHWFQPMTGITAEKHDSFICPGPGGTVIMKFRGKELIKGEPDASSLPSGSLRMTFEARGYTAWDPSSYAFIKDNVLCIPTAFFSYGGEVLDKKTPLLLSNEAVSTQAMRILRLFGNTEATRVNNTVGAEQEYFLIDKKLWKKRPDLVYCGRTLVGARPPKGQEMEDHYFGAIKTRVLNFMHELDEELWKLGVLAKTEHNEAAPAQHELAPIYINSNIATDQNQLTMEMMKKVAARHNLACLLHEKPFAGINGSGKHNNWSLNANDGTNLFAPGDSPRENAQFLLFLSAVIKAVDEYQDLLRMSVTSAGNDHRLGGCEAPPAIISIYLGEELSDVLEAIEKDKPYSNKQKGELNLAVDVLPNLPKDTTDRNRTSPFAYTGNKFEFRMMGSSDSVAGSTFVLNTIVADALCEFADRLEKAEDFHDELNEVIRETIIKHKRILFSGNNYSDEWVEDAGRRGLSNLKSSNVAIRSFIEPKNMELFERHHVLTRAEILSRYEILLDNYNNTINIEAATLLDMVNKDIVPAVYRYIGEVSGNIAKRVSVFGDITATESERELIFALSNQADIMQKESAALKAALNGDGVDTEGLTSAERAQKLADFGHDCILVHMEHIRAAADSCESLTDKKHWPYPSYGDLLFSVR